MRKGWKILKVGDLAQINPESLGVHTPKDYAFSYIDLSMVDEGNITYPRNKIIFKNASPRARRIVKSGDIIMSTVRPNLRGFARVEVDTHNLVCSTGFAVLRCKNEQTSEYLNQYLLSDFVYRQIDELVVGSNYPAINNDDIRNLEVTIPIDRTEQHKIATILRTWDEAIEKTEGLIKANEKRLFLLTNSLIFGHARLGKRPMHERTQHKWVSSPKDWKLQQIGDIAVERSELNTGGATHTVLSCSKHDGFVRSLEYFKKQIFSKNLAGYKTIYRGDFGFPSNHVEEGSIGLQNLEDRALVSPIYIIFTPDKKRVHADFLFRLLKTKTYAHIFRASTSSSVDRRGNLRWKEFSSIPVCLPDLYEQKEISEFLTEQQSLIEGLYRYKRELQSQKRGLMQKLLTGAWQVKIDETLSINKKDKIACSTT